VKAEEDHKLVEARPFVHCPWCASPLIVRENDGRKRHSCRNCDFIWYRNPIPAAGAILEIGGKILLVKRKYPPKVGDWCFPAGFMEYDESPVQCCRREIKEETGLDIKINRLFWVYSGHDDPRSNAILIMYMSEISGGELAPGDDAIEVEYFDMHATPRNIAFQAHREAIADYRRFVETGLYPGQKT
jgi:ADP-ribose pyrophosphatase YjhB (NUDIX family)